MQSDGDGFLALDYCEPDGRVIHLALTAIFFDKTILLKKIMPYSVSLTQPEKSVLFRCVRSRRQKIAVGVEIAHSKGNGRCASLNHAVRYQTTEELMMLCKDTVQRTSGLAIWSSILLAMFLSACHAFALDKPERKVSVTEALTQDGMVDWTTGVVTATGIGFPPKESASALHAEKMAKRAALGVAQRNLLEAMKAVRVDSTTLVKNYTVASDEIRVSVEGYVENAKVVKEREVEKGAWEITLEMKLTGKTSALFLPTDAPKPTRLSPMPPTKDTGARSYTGLVVDARGIGVVPAMAPRIVTEDGAEAYSQTYVQAGMVDDQGIVAYVADVQSAKTNPRVTNYPLVVKALKVAKSGRSDLVISNADAQTIHGVPEHFKFLEKAQVIIIVDASAKQR